MAAQDTMNWVTENWTAVALVVVLVRNFINNLLANCPSLKANNTLGVVQGVFNAAVQTITQQKRGV